VGIGRDSLLERDGDAEQAIRVFRGELVRRSEKKEGEREILPRALFEFGASKNISKSRSLTKFSPRFFLFTENEL